MTRSKIVRSMTLPAGSGHGLDGSPADVSVRPSSWITDIVGGVIGVLTAGNGAGGSHLVLLTIGGSTFRVKRVYSSYDRDVLVDNLTGFLEAGDLSGIADRYRVAGLQRLTTG